MGIDSSDTVDSFLSLMVAVIARMEELHGHVHSMGILLKAVYGGAIGCAIFIIRKVPLCSALPSQTVITSLKPVAVK